MCRYKTLVTGTPRNGYSTSVLELLKIFEEGNDIEVPNEIVERRLEGQETELAQNKTPRIPVFYDAI